MTESVDEKGGRRDGKVTVSKCMEFRINPTMEQKILIWKTFGCNRFVWNHDATGSSGTICLMSASAMRRRARASSSIPHHPI